MSDSYQTALMHIMNVLKTSPGSATVENLLRLASIYKFETFRERIENNLSRISIAGQILVIDIDFEERPTQTKGQTRFHLHSIKLILANNETSFRDVNSITGESVLKNSLTLYPDLRKFDLCLERLAAIDQHSIIEQGSLKVDCFEFSSEVAAYLSASFDGNIVINPVDEFAMEVLGLFKIYLVSDERLAATLYNMKNGIFEKTLNDDGSDFKLIADAGFRVEFDGGKPLPILPHLIQDLAILVDDETAVELPNSNDSFKSKRHGTSTTIQMFYMFQSQMAKTTGFYGGDIVHVVQLIESIVKLQQLLELAEEVKLNCSVVDKFAEMDNDALKLSEFLNQANNEATHDSSKMDLDNSFLTISVSEESLDVQGTRDDLTQTILLGDEQFLIKLENLREVLRSEIL